jgi:uncharacterized protein YceH (UPF0502 family)
MIGRLIRQLRGCGKREARADELLREYVKDSAPQRREIAARSMALERLVAELEKDATKWH